MAEKNVLKKLRLQAGMTQQQVADFLGVTKSTISKYENKTRRLNADHVEKLSELYNVEPTYIFFGSTYAELVQKGDAAAEKAEAQEREYWEHILLTEPVRELMPLLNALNDEGQQKAIERVEELTEILRYQKEPQEAQQASTSPDSTTTPEDE